jgi:hypothetical protein
MRATDSQGGKIPLFLLWGAVIFIAGLTCGLLWSPRQPGLRSQVEQSLPQTNEDKDVELSRMRQEVERARAVYELASGKEKREAGASLAVSCAELARYLGEHKQSIPEIVSLLKEGRELEKMAGVSGGEASAVFFVREHLIITWIHDDGDSLLQYLRSPEVSMEEKKYAINWLKDVIETEYPGKE